MKTKSLGRYIVADPDICHGEPTFRGTRILVADVLEQVTNGMDQEAITEEWRGKVTREAIAEAIRLAREALITHIPELMEETADQNRQYLEAINKYLQHHISQRNRKNELKTLIIRQNYHQFRCNGW